MERVNEAAKLTLRSTEVVRDEKEFITATDAETPSFQSQRIEKEISRRQLIDKINNLNFQDRTVNIVFRHKLYPRDLTLRAHPLPCHDSRLACRWVDQFDFNQLSESYTFHHLYLPKGQQFLEVVPEVRSISEDQILFSLPETCREISVRKLQRNQCAGIITYMFQNGATYYGRLIDYGAWQFRVAVATIPPQTFRWIDDDAPVTILFTKLNTTLYSGECRIVRHDRGLQERQYTLEPLQRQIRRFAPREFRTTRHALTPPPDVSFEHPLFGKHINLKVYDISGCGLSVEEEESAAVLLPGLIIPNLELTFSDGSSLHCMAQVVYCKTHYDRKAPYVRCGLAIVDISVEDHIRLLGVMHQATDAHCYVCNKVDMTALWDFFFETGFIYPQKYEFIQANKEHIKATYEKLYNNSPSIASHFIYKQNGRIMAHAATMRFYESSWMLHHHAAIRSSQNRGGLIVLNQSGRFINESHRLYAMKMDYVFCYFRPENKFPAHVFGGSARNIKNPKICSLDLFAYFHHRFDSMNAKDLPGYWRLDDVGGEDLNDLHTFYESQSGGLMLQGLHLSPDRHDCSGLIEAFRNIGLTRERHLFALRYRDKLSAIIMANVADLGLNMSDLTNAVTIIEVDPQPLTQDIIQSALNRIVHFYGTKEVPVLLYPQTAAARMGIESEKSYCLWVYDTQNLDYYFKFLKRLLKFIQH
ncbi:MAG: hypothetical protein C4519_27440 [Desulfobacteraceae bacterium]|nr:MAG: hypothetical protein C4519_27440 [Desulfobacteraceae bacterium]